MNTSGTNQLCGRFRRFSEFDERYGQGRLGLYMLRHQLGDDAFYRAMKHYLEANRGKNSSRGFSQSHRRDDSHQRRSVFRPMDLRRRRSEV